MIYFAYVKSCDSQSYGKFVIVPKDFWDTHHHLLDSFVCSIPEGFTQVAESMYKYNGKIKNGIQLLIDNGFVENEELQKYLS